MWNYLKNFENKFHLGYTTIVIAVLTLSSKMLGFGRDLLLASNLGLSRDADIYFTAFRIPDLIYNLLILGTLSVAFIPVFTEYYLKDKQEAKKIALTVLNFAVLMVAFLALFFWIILPYIARFLAPGFSAEELQTTVTITRWLLISPIIFTASSVLSSTLLSLKKFIWVNAAPIFYNLGIIFGIVWLYPIWGMTGLVIGVLIGACLHFLIQLPQIWSLGFSWRPFWDLNNPGARKIFKLFLPRILGFDVSYINLLVVSVVGSVLPIGTIAAFNFASNIQTVPLGIFALSTAVAIFPGLSENFATEKHKEYIKVLTQSIVRVLYFILPAAVLMLLLRAYVVRLLIGYGKCDWSCTITTFDTLGLLSITLVAQAVIPLLSRAFYARQNTRTPVFIGLVAIGINVIFSYLLSYGLGVIGITLGFLIATYVQLFLLSKFLYTDLSLISVAIKQELQNQYQQLSNQLFKITISCLIMGLSTYGLLYILVKFVNTDTVVGILIQTTITLAVSSIIYLFVTVKFGILQASQIIAAGKKIARYLNLLSIE